MMQRVLALDVDGVLIDPDRGGRGRWHTAVHDRFGVSPTQLSEGFFQVYWHDIVVGRQPVESALAAAISDNEWPFDVETFLQVWFETDFDLDDRVVDWAADWAERGCRIVLATDQEHRRATFLRRHLGERLLIDAVCYSADLGAPKRDPDFFRRAGETFGIEAGSVVFVDDGADQCRAATEAGWRSVQMTDVGCLERVDELLRAT